MDKHKNKKGKTYFSTQRNKTKRTKDRRTQPPT